MLRASVAVGNDDLFLAGDTQQRIYDNRVTLRELGIIVTGRSTRLIVNYRTTAEILAWSLGLLRGEPIDDMDGGLDAIADADPMFTGCLRRPKDSVLRTRRYGTFVRP
ncbi:hypothetical protein [Nocardia aurea]|uniref:hypothetical protein n=1 Tax=Nocardia aurea TaxID=2144174 RepID=UPI001E369795|nr:hypothetical protein [Nocardia aurea]